MHDVYCGDDALILQNVHRQLNKLGVVSMDISLRHPRNEASEKDYQQWNKYKDKNYKEKKGFCYSTHLITSLFLSFTSGSSPG